ncbi:MAG: T9SS type A sorting domain-containing protein, partial [Bacteroidales bacterium]
GNVAELEFFGKSRLDGINDITTDQSHYATINIDGDNNIKLQIDESAPFPRKAELFSHDGKILNSISTQDNQLTLSRLREPNGIYLIRVSMGNTTEVYKVIL